MGKETAENLCSYVNCKISEELEDQTKILATKTDLAAEAAALRSEIVDFKIEFLVKLGEYKADTMRWMFIFWVGQVAVTFGLFMFFLKK